MRSTLVVTTPAEDTALASIETMRVAAGLAADDSSRDAQLTSLALRLSAEIVNACSVVAASGAPPTLRQERLTETFFPKGQSVGTLVLSRRHEVAIVSVTEDDDALTLDAEAIDVESGLLDRLIDGTSSQWCASKIVVVYDAGFGDEIPPDLEGCVGDLARIRLSEAAADPLAKAVTIEIPGVETVRTDRWVGGYPGQASSKNTTGLPPEIMARLGRYTNQWV